METIDKLVVELNSNCVCEDEDGNFTEDCYGCWIDAKEDFKELMTTWATAQKFDEANQLVLIQGQAMGWQRRSGYAVSDLDSVSEKLFLNGDFRLVFTLDGENLTCVRYSHDEPTGASFTFTTVANDEE